MTYNVFGGTLNLAQFNCVIDHGWIASVTVGQFRLGQIALATDGGPVVGWELAGIAVMGERPGMENL